MAIISKFNKLIKINNNPKVNNKKIKKHQVYQMNIFLMFLMLMNKQYNNY